MKKETLIKKINSYEEKLKPLKAELQLILQEEEQAVESKIERCYNLEDKYEEKDLRISKTLCSCGLPLAHDLSVYGAWHCSGILLATADQTKSHSFKNSINEKE